MAQFNEFVINNWLLFLALFVVLALLLRTYVTPAGVNRVNPNQAVRKMNQENALCLDVRSESEFEKGHILNSINIPLALLDSRISEIKDSTKAPVIIICQSGNRSMQAASMLKKQGFEDLYNLDGGIMAWTNANLPVNHPGKKKDGGKKKNKKEKHADAGQA